MVQTGAQWRLVATRSGTNDLQRKIAISHPKELCFALRESINHVGGMKVERGHFQRYAPLSMAEGLLNKQAADAKKAEGEEAKQRREITLYDHEQIDLFESFLRCSVASSGTKRAAIETLTLSVITSLYFALGARGLNIDTLSHGYLSVSRWNDKTWDGVSPLVMRLKSGAKGNSANATKHLQEVMHHRDPMR